MSLFNHSNYLFIFAHPDDEIYTCVTISELLKQGKTVDVMYITSGDYNGPEFAVEREKEVLSSMKLAGLSKENITFLRVPERQLMDKAAETYEKVVVKTEILKPDCLVGHDFEGGHNMHDLVSYLAYQAARKLDIPLYFFPAYFGWPEKRHWNRFVNGSEADYELKLDAKQKILKRQVVDFHKSQLDFMNSLLTNPDAQLFFSREVLKKISESVSYTMSPVKEMGYEYPGSKIKFGDFKKIIEDIK
jgi:LmbE family N-acetylglucosaminyl deacetylase